MDPRVIKYINNKVKRQYGVVPTQTHHFLLHDIYNMSWQGYEIHINTVDGGYEVLFCKTGTCFDYLVSIPQIKALIDFLFDQERLLDYVVERIVARSGFQPTIKQDDYSFTLQWDGRTLKIKDDGDVYNVTYDTTDTHDEGEVENKNIYSFLDLFGG